MQHGELGLERSIEGLYTTFGRYCRPSSMLTDGGTVRPETSPLLSRPLRAIEGEEIAFYAGKALTTWGNENDYRYFLPRILELATQPSKQAAWVNLEIILGKLAYTRWWDWPTDERQSVDAFLDAWWAKTVRTYADAQSAATTLSAIARITDIDRFIPLLHEAARTDIAGRRALADFVCDHWDVYDSMLRNRPPWSSAVWWDEYPERHLKLVSFLFGDDAAECLRYPFIDPALEPTAYEVEFVSNHVAWYLTARSAILGYIRDPRWERLRDEIVSERVDAEFDNS